MASPSRSPPAPPDGWSCLRCTFFNPEDRATCEICEASRPVEVDVDRPVVVGAALVPASPKPSRRKMERSASPPTQRALRPVEVDVDSPVVVVSAALAFASPKPSRRNKERSASPPPQWFGRKRERDASPDVVDLCDSAGKEPPAKKGSLESCLEKKPFKIMTYNVWFREDMELIRRMDALGDLIKKHSPDFICFQEVTPYIYMLMQKSGWWPQYKCLLSHEKAIQGPYYCMQLSKVPAQPTVCIPFSNSIMGRELCTTSVSTGEMKSLKLGTTHLESPCPAPPKWDQMYSKERVDQAKKCLEILGRFPNAILCGDMNWDDKGDGPFPLQDGWTDAWVELKPGEDGWTYDTKANGMLSGNRKLQKRMDRFVCKLTDFKIDSIEMIGKEANDSAACLSERSLWACFDHHPSKRMTASEQQL